MTEHHEATAHFTGEGNAQEAQGQDVLDMIKNTKDMSEAIGLAIGAASTCWESMEGTGVFDSARASMIVAMLNEKFDNLVPSKAATDALKALLGSSEEIIVLQAAQAILRFDVAIRD